MTETTSDGWGTGSHRTETMNLDQIPTPETDAMASMRRTTSEWVALARDLERRLTVARDALKKLDNWLMRDAQRKQITEQALTLTAPKP